MPQKIPFVAMSSDSSHPEKVWQLGRDTAHLFMWASEIAAELLYYQETSDAEAARHAIARTGDLVTALTTIREEDALLRYFALAYKDRLGGTYVVQENGKSYIAERTNDNRPCEVDPLEYGYQSYTDKALHLIERMLDPLVAVGNDVDAAAAAMPFLLDLTYDRSLVTEFVAELRQETMHAARLAMSNASRAISDSSDLEAPNLNEALQQEALNNNEVCVLKCMQSRRPVLMMIEDIMAATGIGRDTVIRAVNNLIELELAHRPRGRRKGATITAKGLKIAARINAPGANQSLVSP